MCGQQWPWLCSLITNPDFLKDTNGGIRKFNVIKTQGFIIDGTSGDDAGITAVEGTAANDRIHGLAGSD